MSRQIAQFLRKKRSRRVTTGRARRNRSRMGGQLRAFERLEDRVLLASDMTVRFDVMDLTGNPVDFMVVGNNYDLAAYVQDTRDTPTGVSQAYFDVSFDEEGMPRPFGKKNWRELAFFKIHEEFIRTHTDEEVLKLAKQKGVFKNDQDDKDDIEQKIKILAKDFHRLEALKKQRQRMGIKKSPGAPRKKTLATKTMPTDEKFPPEFLDDWRKYLSEGTF